MKSQQAMRIDHLKYLNIEKALGLVKFEVDGESLLVLPQDPPIDTRVDQGIKMSKEDYAAFDDALNLMAREESREGSPFSTDSIPKLKRTKAKYELLCNTSFSVWGIKELLDNGHLFYLVNGEYIEVSLGSDIFAIEHFLSGSIYRRIETPIEWWVDACDHVKSSSSDDWELEVTNDNKVMRMTAEMTRDQWCDFARILLEQGE